MSITGSAVTRVIPAVLLAASGIAGCIAPQASSAPAASPSASATLEPSASLALVTSTPGPSETDWRPSPWLEPSISVPPPTPAPTPTAPPTPRPTRSPGPTATPEIPHVDPALEAYLPARVAGKRVTTASLSGAEVAATAGGDTCVVVCGQVIVNLAETLGMSPGDMTVALGTADGVAVFFEAYHVPGVTAQRLLDAIHQTGGSFLNRHAALMSPMTLRIGSRDVLYIPSFGVGDPGDSATGEYDVAYDGVLIEILGEAPSADGTIPEAIVAAVEALR